MKALFLLPALSIFFFPFPIQAHTASSGMDYDASCCGGHDCRQIEDSKVKLELSPIDGGWVIIPTAEIFLTKDRSKVKTSTDGHFHRCSAENGAIKAHTYCLYVPGEA